MMKRVADPSFDETMEQKAAPAGIIDRDFSGPPLAQFKRKYPQLLSVI